MTTRLEAEASGSPVQVTNRERPDRIQEALRIQGLDLVVCALPANVLMMSGYAPVIGNGVALAFAGGPLALLIPEDEVELAGRGWADEVQTFRPGSLERAETLEQAIAGPLSAFANGRNYRIGFENAGLSQPVTYSAVHVYGGAMQRLLTECFPGSSAMPADHMLAHLRAEKTAVEVERIRAACRIAGAAFAKGRASLTTGSTEIEVANAFRAPLSTGMSSPQHQRADGFAWCMSGPNSALAAAAYARSRTRKIEANDLVLVHCNSFADGYWTDITRTYVAGSPDRRQTDMFAAVFDARAAALEAIAPESSAAAVDRAARAVMEDRGFGPAFKHSTGHGVGFGAIDAGALPRLHPASPDKLKRGMVFNVEPAVYFEGYGGIRHCDVVTVTENGYEVLTPFQCDLENVAEEVT